MPRLHSLSRGRHRSDGVGIPVLRVVVDFVGKGSLVLVGFLHIGQRFRSHSMVFRGEESSVRVLVVELQ